MSSGRILVIEDEPEIRRFLRTALTADGFEVHEATTGDRGLIEAGTRRPDLVVLDLGLPDIDGLDVLRRLREWTHVPIVILSARAQEAQKIAALDAGADDYVTKPFGIGELLARVRVALRHAGPATTDAVFRAGDLEVDLEKRLVRVRGAAVHLTPIEFRLLAQLVKHAGKVLTHRHLLLEVWGPSHRDDSHYLRIYMAQLRQKLEADPARPRWLQTEVGVGYRFVDDDS